MNIGAMTPATIYIRPGKEEFLSKNRMWQGIPGIERTKKGRIYATWYSGGETEEAGNVLIVEKSDDDGKTWTDGFMLVQHDDPEVRCFDETLWLDPKDRLWIFWAQSRGKYDGRCGVWGAYTENADDGTPVFTEPVRLGNGIMMNKPTVAKDGTWYFAMNLWPRYLHDYTEDHSDLDWERLANVYVSLDEGKTFEYRGGTDGENRGFDEHMIVELNDGRLWMLTRTSYGVGQAFSEDQGKTWTPIERSGHTGPNSRIHIRRLKSGRILLINHVNPTYQTSPKGWHTRNNLMAMLSEDDGRTWRGGLMLDTRDTVSYPDGTEDDEGYIRIIYDRQRFADREILMAVFTEEDILEGRLVSGKSQLKVLVNKATGPKSTKG